MNMQEEAEEIAAESAEILEDVLAENIENVDTELTKRKPPVVYV